MCPYGRNKTEEKKNMKSAEESKKQHATYAQIIQQTTLTTQNITLNSQAQLKPH